MKGYVFPGQGAQFPGMGKDLFENNDSAKSLFKNANKILDFAITDVMFGDDVEALKETRITQPAIFLHSVILALTANNLPKPSAVAGHSLGEFSALVINKVLSFEDALLLVAKRAEAMQKACDAQPSTMAAIVGLSNETVEKVCENTSGIVVPANYNCPGQLVISGEINAVNAACETLKKEGARMAMPLKVAGAFHSPLMQPAKEELATAIASTTFQDAETPIYQNFTALPETDPEKIKDNLVNQLTGAVKWTQSVEKMIDNGISEFTEIGPGKVLQGLIKKTNRSVGVDAL